MSMQPIVTNHIELCADHAGGSRAYVVGTKIRVADIYRWAELERQSPHAIIAAYPELTLADVHAALAYYWDHEVEMLTEAKRDARLLAEKSSSLNGGPAGNCLELAARSGFLGSAPDAPADLSTHPRYMDGFGRGQGTR